MRNFLLIVASIAALILVCAIVDWFIPSNIHNGLVIASLHFVGDIGIGLAVVIMLFFGCKAVQIYKTEKSFGRELLKMTPAIIFWLGVLLYLANFLVGGGNYDCQKYNYTSQLNGGVKYFQGRKYAIKICGSGVNNSHFFGDSMDPVELTITNDQGEILAKRHYKVFWDGQPGHEPLTIGVATIIYQDDDTQIDHSIAMPPTAIDWIRARVPVLNW